MNRENVIPDILQLYVRIRSTFGADVLRGCVRSKFDWEEVDKAVGSVGAIDLSSSTGARDKLLSRANAGEGRRPAQRGRVPRAQSNGAQHLCPRPDELQRHCCQARAPQIGAQIAAQVDGPP